MLFNTFMAVTVFINLLVSSDCTYNNTSRELERAPFSPKTTPSTTIKGDPTSTTFTTDEEGVPYEIISWNNVECIKASKKSDRVELRSPSFILLIMSPNINVYDGCNTASIIHYEYCNGYLRWRSRASNSIKIVFRHKNRIKRWLTFRILSEKDWVEGCHEYKEYPDRYEEHHPRTENRKHKPVTVPTTRPTTMPTTIPTIKTEETFSKKQSGSFSSLNYPNNYPTNVDYFYKIKLDSRKRVCLNITDLELQKENDNTPCKDDNRDYIKILDGLDSWSNPL
ncbi:uncharacterized protein LOC124450843 isoform X2 [Xenia sp. Carnegie-2017]|uniref:uncharacterized protein LOC124450843 isoform X2 n=1 Tax=Xenia sp. Carnegie-2017 TaxID=2897299 RepID=UPI001F04BEF8|nr:uncharacterized protein LOC124450843 isoform X2 [Xenia sp. Carnegie-2017]